MSAYNLRSRTVPPISFEHMIQTGSLGQVPHCYRTRELCTKAMEYRPQNIRYVPSEYLTQEYVIEFVSKRPYLLQSIPKPHLTYDVCLAAVSGSSATALASVPKQFRTPEIYRAAIFCTDSNWSVKLCEIPVEQRTLEMCTQAFKNHKWNYESIPASIQPLFQAEYEEWQKRLDELYKEEMARYRALVVDE